MEGIVWDRALNRSRRSSSGRIPLCSVGELEIWNPSYGRVGNGPLAQPRGTSFSGKPLRARTRISLSWRSEGDFRERRANSRAPRDVESPRATDLRLSKLGQDGGMRDSYRRVWERMDRRKDGGWHVSGYAVCRDNRPPDLILFCTRDADGEWVVRTTATPFSTSAQYLRNSARYDFEFLGSRPPDDAQLGAWEAHFPPGVFGTRERGNRFGLGVGFLEGELLLPS